MYVLATTEDMVRWYSFNQVQSGVIEVQVHDALDLRLNTVRFETKDAAKQMALAAGLKTWRYVRF